MEGDRSRGGPSLLPELRIAEPVIMTRSTVGRPRLLADHQVEVILMERARFLAWRALRRTVKSERQLARKFGVSPTTIHRAIRTRGEYKQASPEERPGVIASRKRKLDRLQRKGWL